MPAAIPIVAAVIAAGAAVYQAKSASDDAEAAQEQADKQFQAEQGAQTEAKNKKLREEQQAAQLQQRAAAQAGGYGSRRPSSIYTSPLGVTNGNPLGAGSKTAIGS